MTYKNDRIPCYFGENENENQEEERGKREEEKQRKMSRHMPPLTTRRITPPGWPHQNTSIVTRDGGVMTLKDIAHAARVQRLPSYADAYDAHTNLFAITHLP